MENTFNPETARLYHFRYMREYRAVCVLWAVLTIIWCTLNVVVFVQPQWIGDTPESPGFGHQGVYAYCYPDNINLRYECSGSFTDFNSIIDDSYKATTFFVGVAALLMLISVAALLLFFCFKKTAVFILVGILEIITGMSEIYGNCCVYMIRRHNYFSFIFYTHSKSNTRQSLSLPKSGLGQSKSGLDIIIFYIFSSRIILYSSI